MRHPDYDTVEKAIEGALRVQHHAFRPDEWPEVVKMYKLALEGFSFEAICAALATHTATNPWFPTITQLLAALPEAERKVH